MFIFPFGELGTLVNFSLFMQYSRRGWVERLLCIEFGGLATRQSKNTFQIGYTIRSCNCPEVD